MAGDGESSLAMALSYAERGWLVLPGASWLGPRSGWVAAGSRKRVAGARPIVPRSEASADADRVRMWWSLPGPVVPSVLLASGDAWCAVSVPYWVGRAVVGVLERWSVWGPVVWRPDIGRAYLLVEDPDTAGRQNAGRQDTAAVMEAGLAAVGAELMPRGSWLVAPPSVVPVAPVRWVISPHACGWRPLPWASVTTALSVATTAPVRVSRRVVSR